VLTASATYKGIRRPSASTIPSPFHAVLPTPGKIIRPGYQKNLAAAAACMVIVDLFFLQQFKKDFGEL
jgi:hypothetical protein